ncbi:PhoD-like phosphatase [Myxosarcina sp. GI1(2024)]
MKYSYQVQVRELPLILAGPILRRTEADRVTVWLALKAPCLVKLQIYATRDNGATLTEVIARGQSNTIQLGKHLNLVTVTAAASADNLLQPERLYGYNLWFGLGDRQIELLAAANTENFTSQLSYFSHQLPTFCLPANDVANLRLVHGSCRKPHGGGKDSLALLDNSIRETADLPQKRPQQLFLTGDQIYADDVADPILWAAQGMSESLMGWQEKLPLQRGKLAASQMPPGKRSELARLEGGFTAMLDNKPEKAKSHLVSLGEYLAAYLLAWSPVIQLNFPQGKSLFDRDRSAQAWDKEVRTLQSFIASSPKVRRALANIATYTICDDHDISDDWYLNRKWCDRVLSKPLGRRALQNALLAYALCQAWGNTPQNYSSGTSGEKLLQAAVRYCSSAGTDPSASAELERYLGIPALDPATGLPQLQSDGEVSILQRDRQALNWHYSLQYPQHQIIVIDTRTWRGYPAGTSGIEPPMLLSPTAFQQQLETPLAVKERSDILTILVLPTNIVTLSIIDRIQKLNLNKGKVFGNDVGDSWNFNQVALAQLLYSICHRRERVVILSGDIHYSCAVRLSQWFRGTSPASVLVQLTSSAIKNAEWKTSIIHTKLKHLLPEPTENWLVWQKPLKLVKLTWWQRLGLGKLTASPQNLPNWQYRIEWIESSGIERLGWGRQMSQAVKESSFWQRVLDWIAFLLWRNPWFQTGREVVGHNNLSLVRFQLGADDRAQAVVQETYWHPPWDINLSVKSSYVVSLNSDSSPPLEIAEKQA